MESALGPVTTMCEPDASGSTLFWLRSSVIDSRAACRVASRPDWTAASALATSTCGWSKRPSLNFRVRIRVTAWLIRDTLMLPLATSCWTAVCHWSALKGSMAMSTPALMASAAAPARSAAMWYVVASAGTSP